MAHSLLQRPIVPTAHCSTRMCEMHHWAGVLTISATYRNVLFGSSAHVQWKLVKFRQGVQMVKVRAKLLTEDESSSDLSGLEPHDESTTVFTTEETPHLINVSEPILDPSIVPTHVLLHSSPSWGSQVPTTDFSAPTLTVGLDSTVLKESVFLSATPLLPDEVMSPSSLTDVHWFVTESFPPSTIHATPVLTGTIAFPVLSESADNTTADTTELTPQDSPFTTEQTLNITLVSSEHTPNVTVVPPDELGDEGVTEEGVDIPATMTMIPTSRVANTVSAVPTSPTANTTSHQATTRTTATTETSASGRTTTTATTSRQYLCNLDRRANLVKMGKLDI